MNGQIVLCRGVNDGAELERSIRDLTAYMPQLESVSVVPVGLTRYRDGLYPLEPFTKEDACEVLDLIHGWQEKLYKEWGNHFIHAGDEWYILAERPIPEEKDLRWIFAAGKRSGNGETSGRRSGTDPRWYDWR